MLETIRQYAREKLEETGEVEHVRQRHLDFFLQLAMNAEPNLVGPEPLRWLQQLDSEYDNVRAALRAAIESQHIDKGLQLVSALRHYWQARGYFTEGRAFAGQLLAASDITGADLRLLRAKVLEQTAWFAILQNDFQTAETLLLQSIALYQKLGDNNGITHALANQSFIALNRGDANVARSLIDQALVLVTTEGDKRTLAQVFNMRGLVLREQGDYVAARASIEQALAFRRTLADKHAIANSLNDLGATAFAQGDPAAEAFLETSLQLRRELADRFGIPRCLHDLGAIALNRSNLARAHECFTQGLAIFRDQSDHRNAVKCLEGLAGVAAANHQTAQAARLFGAAEAAREAIGVPLPRTWRVNYDRAIAMVRQQLKAAELAAVWANGRTMSLEQAIAFALTEIKIPDAPIAPLSSPRQTVKEKFGGLTGREREVATLIAQGKSNREIADALVLSERTVEGHVGNILNKLGFHTRTQIATWATQQGLKIS
jgi:non-specific serine/threonine protein kinase